MILFVAYMIAQKNGYSTVDSISSRMHWRVDSRNGLAQGEVRQKY